MRVPARKGLPESNMASFTNDFRSCLPKIERDFSQQLAVNRLRSVFLAQQRQFVQQHGVVRHMHVGKFLGRHDFYSGGMAVARRLPRLLRFSRYLSSASAAAGSNIDPSEATTHFGFQTVPLAAKQAKVNDVFHGVAEKCVADWSLQLLFAINQLHPSQI